ncbi:hypothetical protein [Mucilaginibacter sp. 44-25]|nr:hypothetical protein [Mucilaginibacter sp. 44-25]
MIVGREVDLQLDKKAMQEKPGHAIWLLRLVLQGVDSKAKKKAF